MSHTLRSAGVALKQLFDELEFGKNANTRRNFLGEFTELWTASTRAGSEGFDNGR